MIVKNEENVLDRCLSSVSDLVDEIIVVDTGSTDSSREIAARFTEKVFDFPWRDDFAAARNESFSHASMDYCMWLDADDVLLDADRAAFLSLKSSLSPDISVVMAPYHTGFDENGQVTFSYYRERLIKNHAGMTWEGAVHEVITPTGNILYADFAVTHRKAHPSDPDRNLRIYRSQLVAGKELDPRQQFYYGRELYYHHHYEEALTVFQRFWPRGRDGWKITLMPAATAPIVRRNWGMTAKRWHPCSKPSPTTVPGPRFAVKWAVGFFSGSSTTGPLIGTPWL